MNHHAPLPPGQKAIERFPRFGSTLFANRFPTNPDTISIRVSGLVQNEIELAEHLDRLDGQPLSIDHGAPIRLVAPKHYAYMSPKHVKAIICTADDSQFKSPVFKFMSHPVARVALEERSQSGPGWMFRYLYRPLVRPTIRQFEKASQRVRSGSSP